MERTREQWLHDRRSGIGGSDAAAVLGLSPYAGPIDVWMDKKGLAPDRPELPHLWWGRELEQIIRRRYVETTRTEVAVRPPYSPPMRHPDQPCLLATPDGICVGRKLKGLEIKTANVHVAEQWGEEGTDQIPEHYLIQCMHYMDVLGFTAWDVAVLIGGSDFRIYRVERDDELVANMHGRLLEWWERYVVGDERPAMDASEGSRRALRALYPAERLPLVVAPEHSLMIASQLKDARGLQKIATDARTLCENQLKEIIGDRAGLEGPDWRVTWKKTKDREGVDWEAVATELHNDVVLAFVSYEKAQGFAAAYKELVAKHTVTTLGERRFTFKETGGAR